MVGDGTTRVGRLATLLALLLALTACSPFGRGASSPTTAPANVATPGAEARLDPVGSPIPTAPVVTGGRIVEGGLTEPRTLNPLFVADPLSEALSSLVFSGLVSVDPVSAEPRPDLAASWDVSEDGLTYTFHLREGVVWHDGQPFSARDVVFTYDTMMNDRVRSPRYSRLVERVRQVQALDSATVEFDLIRADASFLTTLATLGIVPQHALAGVLPEELITNPFGLSTAVGTGPFSLQQWIRGDRIIFRRHAGYYGGPVAAQEYVYQVVRSSEELLASLREGTIDWAELDPAAAAEAEQVDGVAVERLPSFDMTYVALQLDRAKSTLFTDPRVRRALMLALDREAAVNEFWQGHADIADGTLPPASWAYRASATVYRPDLDAARQLLDEAGWVPGPDGVRVKDGVPLRFTLTTNGDNPRRRQVAEWLIRSWQALGIAVEPEFETWSTVRQRVIQERDFDAVLLGYRWSVDPDQSMLWSSDSFFDGLNVGHYASAEVDALLQRALQATDRAERAELYAQMQEQVMQDLPVIPLAFPHVLVARSERLQAGEITAILVRNRADIAQWVPVVGE
ncbi:ABC transporter substrate-binding protein [Sphaerobacter sp.]|uniref:ABC transporter substrate-binding protein n=1 Tax=Sphaerobacter sp. TaxID=2099654 RepID=UPI001D2CCE68|nr:ABC transporter substrate-binding protein [Sphaerobacter sp.]MBX5444988.1 ABC transporter substrate-binding protein [Sphaerobacter sp.]